MENRLDPSKFVIVPHVAVVDEFILSNDSGQSVAVIDRPFLLALADHMNDREEKTGDLSPLVLGKHTKDGEPEALQPEVVGYAKNWSVGPFFKTGKDAAFADFWILKEDAPRIRDKYTRRSAELWVSRHEVDPISLLGATTPARDLGLLKLSRDGSIEITSPGDLNVPDEKKTDDTGDKAGMAELKGLLEQVLAAITALGDSGAHGAAPDELTDEELAQLLGSAPGAATPPEDTSRAGEKPVPNAGGYAGGANTEVPEVTKKMQRDLDETRAQLARLEVKGKLNDARMSGKDVNPDDQELISDLISVPPDIRGRQIDRIIALARPLPMKSGNLDHAARNSTGGSDASQGAPDEATRDKIVKLAREKNITYESAFEQTMGRPLTFHATR